MELTKTRWFQRIRLIFIFSEFDSIEKKNDLKRKKETFSFSFDAAKMAVEATERFFEDLRKDLGNEQYDRLFSINPTREQLIIAEQEIRERKQFHFLSSTLSIGLSSSDLSFQRTMKQRLEMVMSWLFDITGSSDQPTLDIKGVEITTDNANIHSGSMIVRTLKRRTHKKRKFSFV